MHSIGEVTALYLPLSAFSGFVAGWLVQVHATWFDPDLYGIWVRHDCAATTVCSTARHGLYVFVATSLLFRKRDLHPWAPSHTPPGQLLSAAVGVGARASSATSRVVRLSLPRLFAEHLATFGHPTGLPQGFPKQRHSWSRLYHQVYLCDTSWSTTKVPP